MPLLRLLLVTCSLLIALPALALDRPFSGQDALGERGLLLPVAAPGSGPRWQAGARVHVSAARAILRTVVEQQVEAFKAQHPAAAQYEHFLSDPRVEELRASLKTAGLESVKQQLKAALAQRGLLGAKEKAAIEGIDQRDVQALDAVLEIRDREVSSLVVATEPYVAGTTERLRWSARLPVALTQGRTTTLRGGNLGLDVRTGGLVSEGRRALGASLGLSLWLPTATDGKAKPLRSDLLATPGLGGRWLGLSPHAEVGADLGWLELTARGALTLLEPAASQAAPMRYATVGTALVLDAGPVALAAEADRLADLGGAAEMDRVWLLGAWLRGQAGPVRLGVGAKLPLAPGDDQAFGGLGGPWARRLADLGVGVELGGVW